MERSLKYQLLVRLVAANMVTAMVVYTKNLDKANSNAGRYKAFPELRLGEVFI
jgi:hypothetical protein